MGWWLRWCQPLQRWHESWICSNQSLQRHESDFARIWWLLPYLPWLFSNFAWPRPHQSKLPGHLAQLWLAVKPSIHPDFSVVLPHLAGLQWQQGVSDFTFLFSNFAVVLADIAFLFPD